MSTGSGQKEKAGESPAEHYSSSELRVEDFLGIVRREAVHFARSFSGSVLWSVEDLYQEGVAHCLSVLHRFRSRPGGGAASWVCTVVKNHFCNLLNRERTGRACLENVSASQKEEAESDLRCRHRQSSVPDNLLFDCTHLSPQSQRVADAILNLGASSLGEALAIAQVAPRLGPVIRCEFWWKVANAEKGSSHLCLLQRRRDLWLLTLEFLDDATVRRLYREVLGFAAPPISSKVQRWQIAFCGTVLSGSYTTEDLERFAIVMQARNLEGLAKLYARELERTPPSEWCPGYGKAWSSNKVCKTCRRNFPEVAKECKRMSRELRDQLRAAAELEARKVKERFSEGERPQALAGLLQEGPCTVRSLAERLQRATNAPSVRSCLAYVRKVLPVLLALGVVEEKENGVFVLKGLSS